MHTLRAPSPSLAFADALGGGGADEDIDIDRAASGVYHFSGAPDVNWANFARAIFDEAGLEVTVEDIPTKDFPTPAARPLNSRLDCSSLSAIGATRPQWRPALKPIIEDFKAS
jgi:dTDP-4-dehydrorhamnose reductase